MASKNTKTTASAASAAPGGTGRTDGDSARWIAGLLLLFVGLFMAASVFFSYFNWAADQSGLQLSSEERETLRVEPGNLCGWQGARLGQLLVDNSFGVAGILLPVMLVLTGVRIIRRRPMLFNHSILSLFFITILASLSLGFAFSDHWSLCSSTGWGGAFGIGVATMLKSHIGVVGTLILLVGGWILTGVFINRNFINKVNRAGNVMVDRGGKIVEIVRHKVAAGMHPDAEPLDEPLGGAEEPCRTARQSAASSAAYPSAAGTPSRPAEQAAESAERPVRPSEPEPQPAAARPADFASQQAAYPTDRASVPQSAAYPADRAPAPQYAARPADPAPQSAAAPFGSEDEEESPFLELLPDEPGAADLPAAEEPATMDCAPEPEDDEFVEVDLSDSGRRLVMGPGGLVELERTAAPAPKPYDPDDPFVEITVGEESAPAAPSPTVADRGIVAEPVRPEAEAPVRSSDDPFEEFSLEPPSRPEPAERRPEVFRPEPEEPVGEDAIREITLSGEYERPETSALAGEPALPESSASSEQPAVSESTLLPASPAVPAVSQAPAATGEGVVVTVESHSDREAAESVLSSENYDPLKDLMNYRKPPVTLLEDYVSDSEVTDEEIYENKTRIEETLKYFGIAIQRIKATVGPTVTLYEIVQAQGVKIAKIQGLQNDIAQSLKAESGIRIIAPIPGRGTIGIEVPNRHKQVVSMYSAVRSLRFQESKAELPVVIGRTIQNENFVFDLAKLPHLLVAGATGQGKSVGLNAIITSLLYRKHPAELKFVMIDPKMVEFSLYARIERHFLARMESEEEAVITDPKKAVYTLNALCTEMDNRLELCKEAGSRNIREYNDKFVARRLNPQRGHRFLPYIVVIIDEFADLIMMAKEVEMPVIRLAQKARAVGIHLIIATQRPSVDVITGKIKANFPSRIAFRVVQRIDSQTIIDQPGANQLIGRGDMLISKEGQLTRVQCALVETEEVERIVDHIAAQQGYTSPYLLPDYAPEGGDGGMGSEESAAPVKYDSLFAEIAREAVGSGQISVSMIQRNYEVGFNRAGRIMLQLERAGIVGRQQGAKPRDILFHDSLSLEAKLQDLGLS